MTEVFGILGAIFFGVCAFPQVYQVWKTQETKAISLLFLILWALGEVFMWTYIILDNISTNNCQWPLHFNYLLNALSLGYLITKKVRND